MKVSTLQIEQLYTFTKKHFVEWYDVQTELVDHLANGIEKQWGINPNLSFECALNIEFKKFGVMGFSDVIEEKIKALDKQYRKLIYLYFKAFFKLPKIIITLFFIGVYYQMMQYVDNRLYLIILTLVIVFFVPIGYLIKRTKTIKRTKKETGKKWLFDNTTLQLGGLINVLSIGFSIGTCNGGVIFDTSKSWSNLQMLVFSVFIVLLVLGIYISIYIVSPKLRKHMAKQHPEYVYV